MNMKETFLYKLNLEDPFYDKIRSEFPGFNNFIKNNSNKKCLVLDDNDGTKVQAFCFTDFITDRIQLGINNSVYGDKRLVVKFLYASDIDSMESIIDNYIMRNAITSRANEILVYMSRKRRQELTKLKQKGFVIKYTDSNNFNLLIKPIEG